MSDIFSKKKRSEIMSKIKGRNTGPELKHWNSNIHLEYQPKGLFGNPDFLDWKNKKVIFIDGCFWHQCPIHAKRPQNNKRYWREKLDKNILRDLEVNLAYKNSGWEVVRIWEHDL